MRGNSCVMQKLQITDIITCSTKARTSPGLLFWSYLVLFPICKLFLPPFTDYFANSFLWYGKATNTHFHLLWFHHFSHLMETWILTTHNVWGQVGVWVLSLNWLVPSKPSSDSPSAPVQYDTVETPCHCTNPTVESQCNLCSANESLTESNILPLQAASHSQTTGNGLCVTIWSSRPDHLHRAEKQLSS